MNFMQLVLTLGQDLKQKKKKTITVTLLLLIFNQIYITYSTSYYGGGSIGEGYGDGSG